MSPNFPDNGFPVAFPEPSMAVPPDSRPVETLDPFADSSTPAVAKASEPWYEQIEPDRGDTEGAADAFHEV